MRHEYVGDVGDFGKYALLNALASKDMPLGVVWYLNTCIESNNDGSANRRAANRGAAPHKIFWNGDRRWGRGFEWNCGHHFCDIQGRPRRSTGVDGNAKPKAGWQRT